MTIGFDSTNELPFGTRLTDIAEVLRSLGYQRQDATWFVFRPDDYNYLTGVGVTIERGTPKTGVMVHTRANIWAQKADTDLQNNTIRRLRRRFGGSFETDEGGLRYFRYNIPIRSGPECGCYIARFHLQNNLAKARQYLYPLLRRSATADATEAFRMKTEGDFHPVILGANLLLPFLTSVVEEYLKATYIALFKGSNAKAKVVRTTNLRAEDLEGVVTGEISIEQAIVRKLSFQDLRKLAAAFKVLDQRLDMLAPLKRPFRRRKKSLFDSLNQMVVRRNSLIHANTIDPKYDAARANGDVENIEVALLRIYQSIVSLYKWDPADADIELSAPDGSSRRIPSELAKA